MCRRSNNRKEKGLTLTEILIAFAIFSLLVGILISAFQLGVRAWDISEGGLEVQQNARIALDWVQMELKEAITLDPYVIDPVLQPPRSQLGIPSSVLEFIKAPTPFNEDSLSIVTVRYFLSGKELRRTVNGINSMVIASNINNFWVSRDTINPRFYTIYVHSQLTTSQRVRDFILTSRVGTRCEYPGGTL